METLPLWISIPLVTIMTLEVLGIVFLFGFLIWDIFDERKNERI